MWSNFNRWAAEYSPGEQKLVFLFLSLTVAPAPLRLLQAKGMSDTYACKLFGHRGHVQNVAKKVINISILTKWQKCLL